MSAGRGANPFALGTIAMLVAVAVVGFIAFLLLGAYAGDLRPARNGGAHALSTSGVGFSGAAELIRLTGGDVEVMRDEARLGDDALLILTPGPTTTADELRRILAMRKDLPTLIVLPKWLTRPMRGKPAWAEAIGQLQPRAAVTQLQGIAEVRLSAADPNQLRTIEGSELSSVPAREDRGVIVEIGVTSHYILADPDVLNNRGLATAAGAQRALQLIELVADQDQPIAFDVTLAGFGRNPNLLKLAFEPPFLPLTLCLLLAAALAVLHALRRFGPAAHEERAVAFGKRALAENGAALLRLARRRHRTGGRYVMLTRDAVASATGAPPGLIGEALDRYLDRLNREGEPFTRLAQRAENAPDTRRLLAAVRDLYLWRRTVTRDHR